MQTNNTEQSVEDTSSLQPNEDNEEQEQPEEPEQESVFTEQEREEED